MAKDFSDEKELRDFGMIGRYKVRLITSKLGPRLDVREFIDNGPDGYVGFTRKGIRLDRQQAGEIVNVIADALKAGL